MGELGEPPVVRAVRAVRAQWYAPPTVFSDLVIGYAGGLRFAEAADYLRDAQAGALPAMSGLKTED